mmetsp:Transcript_89311/g.251390  ORF Transcript_89311/g.251390 Transcript_89311/m.251390 type:complete len:486 (+) Transcript_89311:66-1523(+)
MSSADDPMSYTLEPEGQVVRPTSSAGEAHVVRPSEEQDMDHANEHPSSLSTHSSKELSSPCPSSSSTDDQDEEVLHHFRRMQLYHAKALGRRFRSRGWRTMQEIASVDPTAFGPELDIGSGDKAKLLQGLQRYRDGTFEEFYRLPLESIVHRLSFANMASQVGGPVLRADAGTQPIGSTAHDASEPPGQAIVAAPQDAVVAGQGNLAEPCARRFTKFEAIWISAAWSGAAIGVLIATVVRSRSSPAPCNARWCRRIDALLHYLCIHSLLTFVGSLPCLTIAHLVFGLRRPMLSIGLGLSGSCVSTALCVCVCVDCFDRSARVLLPNRSEKGLGELNEGDRILSFNRGVFRVKKVLRKIMSTECVPMCRIGYRLPDGTSESIETTSGHPLWVSGKGWCATPRIGDTDAPAELFAPAVQLDDVLVHHTGAAARVVSIEPYSSQLPPSNLEVDYPGTFFVNGILVHTSMRGVWPAPRFASMRKPKWCT